MWLLGIKVFEVQIILMLLCLIFGIVHEKQHHIPACLWPKMVCSERVWGKMPSN